MSYSQHSVVTLSTEASRVITSIPTTDELLILMSGRTSGGTGGSFIYLRPNSDGSSAYKGVLHYGSSPSSHGVQANPTSGFGLGSDTSGADINSVARITKQGNLWSSLCGYTTCPSIAGTLLHGHVGAMWDSLGVAISTLQFRWDVDNASGRFTGRVEVWYRNT